MKTLAKFMDKIRSSTFYLTYLQILSLKHYNWLIVLFDLLFIMSIYVIVSLSGLVFNQNTFLLLSQSLGTFTNYLILFSTIIYIALLIFSFTFFRYSIQDIIANKLKTRLDFRRIFKLYIINLILFLAVFVFLTISMRILSFALRADFYPYFRDVLAIVTFILYYLIYNSAVTIFFINKDIKIWQTISLTFSFVFSRRLWKLFSVALAFIISMIIYIALYFLSNTIAAFTIFRNANLYNQYYAVYINIFAWIAYLFIYFGIYFNRFYFVRLYTKIRVK